MVMRLLVMVVLAMAMAMAMVLVHQPKCCAGRIKIFNSKTNQQLFKEPLAPVLNRLQADLIDQKAIFDCVLKPTC